MSALARYIARDSRSSTSSSATYAPSVSSSLDWYEVAQLEAIATQAKPTTTATRSSRREASDATALEAKYLAYYAAEREKLRQEVAREEAAARATKELEAKYLAEYAARREALRQEVAREEAAKRAEMAQRQAAVGKVDKSYRFAYKHQKTYFRNQLDDARDADDAEAFEKIQEDWAAAMEGQKKSFNRLKVHEATKPLTTGSVTTTTSSRSARVNVNKPLPPLPTSSRSSSSSHSSHTTPRSFEEIRAELTAVVDACDRRLAEIDIESRRMEQRRRRY